MEFYDRFEELCKGKNISPYQLSKDIGIPQSNMSMWKSTGGIPRPKVLSLLAAYFGVSVDYLLNGDDISAQDDELTDYLEAMRTRPEMRMLFSVSKDATKADVEAAVKIIEALMTK